MGPKEIAPLQVARFPRGKYAKPKPRAACWFKILKKIDDNAYKIELPDNFEVLDTFNVADLSLYKGEKNYDN